jgi:hypothetical protein
MRGKGAPFDDFRKETIMTATKAVASGIAANVVTIMLWGISNVPGWNAVPEEPKAAIMALVSAAVGAMLVYFAPANKHTLPQPEPDRIRVRAHGAEALAQ